MWIEINVNVEKEKRRREGRKIQWEDCNENIINLANEIMHNIVIAS